MSDKIDKSVILIDPTAKYPEPMRKNTGVKFSMYDAEEMTSLNKSEGLDKSLVNSISNIRRGESITRLAFETDPTSPAYYNSLWKHKRILIPDDVLKRIALTDDLVAAILSIRSNHLSSFGRKLEDRFATGFRVEPKRGIMQKASTDQKEELQRKIDAVERRLSVCGSDDGWDDDEKMNLSTFLYEQVRNGVLFGRFATEVLYTEDVRGEKQFHSFRPVDAGTIYQAIPNQDADKNLRRQALRQLERIKNKKLVPEGFNNDDYAWVQVITNQPRQAFTSKEMLVHNLYPVTDVELGGYPITPIDTAWSAVTTHISITTMNRLYFQNGRASKGMVIIKSADVSTDIIAQIRQNFQASINNVANSFRVPIFGIEPTDDISWIPMDTGGRDSEFQFLSDSNARSLCSAFQISPEEIPGMQYLSKGSNSRSLSESDNEYVLEAARDVGVRPLLAHFQDFFNNRILPLLDPDISKYCTLKFYGLDSDSAEKESTRLSQDMALHMTYDEVLEHTEHDPLGKRWGGAFPLNPSWQQAIAPYLTAGEIREKFFDVEGASKDPEWAYVRDPFWFNFQQLQQASQQATQQQLQQQVQPPPGQPQDPQQGGDPSQAQQQTQEQGGQSEAQQGDSEIANGADQVMQLLGKSEQLLPPNRKRLVTQHKKIVDNIMDEWERESKRALSEIVTAVKKK